MKSVHATDIAHAAPLGRGKRKLETLQAIARRDDLLREAATRFFCAGMSRHQAAELLHIKLLRYSTSAWRRDRDAEECPARLAGRLDALLWQILKTRDHVPGAPMIALVLSQQ